VTGQRKPMVIRPVRQRPAKQHWVAPSRSTGGWFSTHRRSSAKTAAQRCDSGNSGGAANSNGTAQREDRDRGRGRSAFFYIRVENSSLKGPQANINRAQFRRPVQTPDHSLSAHRKSNNWFLQRRRSIHGHALNRSRQVGVTATLWHRPVSIGACARSNRA